MGYLGESKNLYQVDRLSFPAGHVFVAPPSMMDPAAVQTFYALCSKHGEGRKSFRLDLSDAFMQLMSREELIDAATAAILRTCDDCVFERQHRESRFPEGAEI